MTEWRNWDRTNDLYEYWNDLYEYWEEQLAPGVWLMVFRRPLGWVGNGLYPEGRVNVHNKKWEPCDASREDVEPTIELKSCTWLELECIMHELRMKYGAGHVAE